MLRLCHAVFSVVALAAIGCQSPPPMQPRLDPAPPAVAGAPPVESRPTAWPEEVPVPAAAIDACSGRTRGESCWLYEQDVARNGDCIELPADGPPACWTTASR
jgi:hypothetical protein